MNNIKKKRTLLTKLLIITLILTSIIIIPSNNESRDINAETATGICKGSTDNTECGNEITLSNNMKTVSSPSKADYQPIWTRELSEFQWTDTTNLNADKWDGTIASSAPVKDADDYYSIDTAEKLAYAVSNLAEGDKIRLTKNIDLMGYKYKWNIGHGMQTNGLSFTPSQLVENVEIDGRGHTIYNLGTIDNWFIRGLKHSTIKDINFVSAKMYYSQFVGNMFMGIFGAIASSKGIDEYTFQLEGDFGDQQKGLKLALDKSNASSITNITVDHSIFYSNGAGAERVSGYISPLGHQIGMYADQIKTTNNSLYAQGAHIGGAFGRPDAAVISNSFSLDSTIVAKGNHSGGFISCTNGGLTVENCFTNNEVYAEKSTGVFIGAIFTDDKSPNTNFKNCYTSGTLEGTTDLGGFIGMVENSGWASVLFENCYSTSIVGMANGGTKLGGFIGSMASSSGGKNSNYTFKNCYAAGEVGHISTNVDIVDSTHKGSETVGGFAGEMGTDLVVGKNITINNVYYDKQTTGMREWQTGNSMDSAVNLTDATLGFDGHDNTGFKANIRGVLTSDSAKSGHGLASLPDTTLTDTKQKQPTGFVGFPDENPNPNLEPNPKLEWVFDGGNTSEGSHNCMYPQLFVFENPVEGVWGSPEVVDLVAASSYASVSTVHENIWEKGEKDQPLPTTTYDTVRELTTRFTMTSYITSSLANSSITIDWKKSDAPVNLYGKEINVIGNLTNSISPTYNRAYMTADKFAPGIEWLNVTVNVNGQIGTRRIRIIPTMNIDPGVDKLSLNDGDTYNHAQDVKFAFSTGVRMSIDIDDATRALYPDKLDTNGKFGDERDQFVEDHSGKLAPMNSFNHQDNDYIVNSKYITENSTASDLKYPDTDTDTDYIHVRLFKINDEDPTQSGVGTSGKLEVDRAQDLLKDNLSLWIDKLNGATPLEKTDVGKYVVEYSCTLPDGRYLRDSKLLMIRKEKYDVSMQVLNYKDENYDTNGTLNSNVFALNADKYTDKSTILNGTYTDKTSQFEIVDGVPINTAIYMVGKKINPDYSVKAIKLEVESFGGTQSQVFDAIKVAENTELGFSYDYYYGSYEVNGEYFVRIMNIVKKYSIVYNQTNELYYAIMNFDSYDTTHQDLIDAGVNIKDIDVDVEASIFVTNNNQTTGTLKIIKNTIDENRAELVTNDKFALKIIGTNPLFQLELLLSSATQNSANEYVVEMDKGTYTFDEVVPMQYELSSFEVLNPESTTPNITTKEFTIEVGKETIINLVNKKINNTGGSHNVTNTLKVTE